MDGSNYEIKLNEKLGGRSVAILATDGFEQVELTEPRRNLENAGAKVSVIAPKGPHIKGWKFKEWGDAVAVDVELSDAKVADYDALILPGGVINPDKLRTDAKAVAFIRAFAETGRTVAAICHGPQLLIEAGLVEGRPVTSYVSIKTDLINAGAAWEDAEVIQDGNFITSRKPEDIPAFSKAVASALVNAAKATE